MEGRSKIDDPWSNIVDLMSALVLVLFLAVLFFVLNYSAASEEATRQREALEAKSAAYQDLDGRYRELEEERGRLAAAKQALEVERGALLAQRERLEGDKQRLIAESAKLTQERAELIAETERLSGERAALVAQTERLSGERLALVSEMERLSGERAALISETERLNSEQTRLVQRTRALNQERRDLVAEAQTLREAQTRQLIKNHTLQEGQDQLLGERRALIAEKEALIETQRRLERERAELRRRVERLEASLRRIQEENQERLDSIHEATRAGASKGLRFDKESGRFMLQSEILFQRGDAALTPAGEAALARVAELIDGSLFGERADQIEGIMVEGHASTQGSDERNWTLSSERALAAVKYLSTLPVVQGRPKIWRQRLFAAAFGESRPVMRGRRVDDRLSRRIEIRILFNQKQQQQRIADELRRATE
ncbi:MAG: OmpA family protein [Myxococcota bacterium]|nr:OmpA family protein [Myxococcota bacterium]